MRRPLLDRDLEVVAHAHRQLRQSPSAAASSRSAANQRRGSPACGRHGHQARDVEPAPPAGRRRGAGTVAGSAAALLRLLAEVHLDEHPGARRAAGDLVAELGPVDRLPARDPRRERPHLVALEPAEEVPAHAARRRAGRPRSWSAAPGPGSRRGRAPRRRRPPGPGPARRSWSRRRGSPRPGRARRGRRRRRCGPAPRPPAPRPTGTVALTASAPRPWPGGR